MRLTQLSRATTLILLAPATILMLAVFVLPLAMVLRQSVEGSETPFASYVTLLGDPLFLRVMRTTLEISIISSAVCLVLGYPLAMHLSVQPPHRVPIYMSLVLLPFWTSILVKSFAFTVVLGHQGLVNRVLSGVMGISGANLLFNRTGVVVGMVHFLLPFMVFPILNSLKAQNRDLYVAASVMGSGRWRIFWRIIFPLSLSGVLAGTIMTLVLSMGMLVTPALLGGRSDIMIANLIDFYTRQSLNWNAAASISITLLVFSFGLIVLLSQLNKRWTYTK